MKKFRESRSKNSHHVHPLFHHLSKLYLINKLLDLERHLLAIMNLILKIV